MLGVFGALWLIAGCADESVEPVPAPVESSQIAPIADNDNDAAVASKQNTAPVIYAVHFDPEIPTIGATLSVSVDATDAEDDPIWFRYTWRLAGSQVGADQSQFTLVDAARGDEIELVVVATDGKLPSLPFSERFEVRNAPPIFLGVEVSPRSALYKGRTISLRPKVRDLENDPIEVRYAWFVNDRVSRETEAEFATDRLRRGDIVRATLIASDGIDESKPFVTPDLVIGNAPPSIRSKPGGTSDQGIFRYEPKVEDLDGDLLHFSLEEAPDGMAIDDASGVITWLPAESQRGIHRPILVVEDSRGGLDRQEIEVRVGVPAEEPVPASGDFQGDVSDV